MDRQERTLEVLIDFVGNLLLNLGRVPSKEQLDILGPTDAANPAERIVRTLGIVAIESGDAAALREGLTLQEQAIDRMQSTIDDHSGRFREISEQVLLDAIARRDLLAAFIAMDRDGVDEAMDQIDALKAFWSAQAQA